MGVDLNLKPSLAVLEVQILIRILFGVSLVGTCNTKDKYLRMKTLSDSKVNQIKLRYPKTAEILKCLNIKM